MSLPFNADVVTKQWNRNPRNRLSVSGKGTRILCPFETSVLAVGPIHVPIQLTSPRFKSARDVVLITPPSSVEVGKEWS